MTDDQARKLDAIYDALFAPPPGAGEDGKPLIEALQIMWTAYQRGSWAGRTLVWLILTLGALAAALTTIGTYLWGSD